MKIEKGEGSGKELPQRGKTSSQEEEKGRKMIAAGKFTWTKKSGVGVSETWGVAELSDLGPSPWVRVWPDACDIGVEVMGRDGPERFYVHQEVKDGEGDVTHWILLPVNKKLRARGVQIHILND